MTNKAVKAGRPTAGLGGAVANQVKGAPVSQSAKKQVKETTKQLKEKIKQKKADEENSNNMDRAVEDAVNELRKFYKDNSSDPKVRIQYLDNRWKEVKTGMPHGHNLLPNGKPHPDWDAGSSMGVMRSLLTECAGSQNLILKNQMRRSGGLGKPKTVTEADFDKVATAEGNGRVYLRGVAKSRAQVETLIKGTDTHVGKGVFGDGIYSAHYDHKSKNYIKTANEVSQGYAEWNRGFTVKFTLKKDTKFIQDSDLSKMWYKFMDDAEKKHGQNFFYSGEYLQPRYIKEYGHMGDKGNFALALGYDAVNVSQERYTYVLNRTKMIIVDEARSGSKEWK